MAIVNPYVVNQLRHLVFYHLDNELVQNALFVASRLHAYDSRSAESSYLVALCHLRLGQIRLAHEISKLQGSRGVHLGCSYVFAQACLLLPQQQMDGIAALERCRGLWKLRNNWNKHSEASRRCQPDAAAIYTLLGKLWRAHGDSKKAVDHHIEALKLNPFMWDAFTGLCDTGAQVQVPNIFQMTPEMLDMAASTNGFNTLTESNDYPSIAEEAPLTTGPLQSQQNISNQMYHYPSSNDPFAIPREQHGGNGLRSAATALFRDFHAGSSSSLGRGSDPAFDALETPTGSRNGMERNSIMEGGEDTAGARAGPIELSVALPRKPRTYPALHPDGPVRARAVTYKSRGASRSETEEPSESLGSRVASFSAATHAASKRTISGQVAQASSSAFINDPMAPQRRSVRLLSQVRPISSKISSSVGGIGSRDGRELKKAKATGTKGRIGLAGPSLVGRATSGHRKLFEGQESESKENQQCAGNLGERGSARPVITEEIKQREAIQYLLDLFAQMAAGLFALTRFQCTEALRIFQAINPTQRDTVWVLSQMGRAHYEETSYVEAEKVFRRIRELSPSRLDGMEIYTATLWHLRNEVELAYLAHELVDIDRLAPESWCAIGNTFSCQGEHERALRCFERATQLDPTFAYAYTHQGHEHVINEEYDQAQASYRRGIAVDERCYTAWFGLGQVYEKLGQFGEAEKHYRRATSINPSNAVLVCRIGVALEKSQRPKAALTQYSAACQLAPRSSNPRFMKARVLLQLSEPQLALTELKVLKDLVPDEANMHFLLADTYSRLRQRGNALKHYTIASTLDPTASSTIKEAIERLGEDDLDDDDDGEDDDDDDDDDDEEVDDGNDGGGISA